MKGEIRGGEIMVSLAVALLIMSIIYGFLYCGPTVDGKEFLYFAAFFLFAILGAIIGVQMMIINR